MSPAVWCPVASPAFRRCKVTTCFPSLQGVSDLAWLRFRPAVQRGCCYAGERSHVYRGGRGTPVFRGPLEGGAEPFLFPNWRNFATQLGRNFFPVRQQRGTVRCPERPQCPASTGTELGRMTLILSINQQFFSTNPKSTSRVRDKLVFINSKNRCYSLFLSSPGLKQGSRL